MARKLEVRLPAINLLIALLVLISPICIAGLISVARADRSLGSMVGSHFKTIAEITATDVSHFIHDRVTDVGVMAMETTILDAVNESNKVYAGKSDADIGGRIQATEKIWNTPPAEAISVKMLGSRASQMLRKHRDFDRRFLRITVTDSKGIPVAATHRTLDYYQGDEDFWQAVYASGRGAVNITDILYDDVTKANYIGIGVPILDPDTNRFLGMVDALVDVSSIFPASRTQFGSTARLMLVKEDGTVIAAPGLAFSAKAKSDEYSAVKEVYQNIAGRETGFVVADLKTGRHVIGFADTGLKSDYGNLGWMVLAAQDTGEAFAPVRMVRRIVGFMSAVGLIAITLLGVFVSLHRKEAYDHLGTVEAPRARTTANV